MSFFKRALSEPSTYAGLSAIVAGLGQIAKINEAPAIADAINSASPSFSSGNWLGGAMVILGSIAVFFKEKGSK